MAHTHTQKKDNKIHRMTSARETISGGVNEKENGDWKTSLHVEAQLLGLCQSRGYKKKYPHINISGRTGNDLWEVMRIAWDSRGNSLTDSGHLCGTSHSTNVFPTDVGGGKDETRSLLSLFVRSHGTSLVVVVIIIISCDQKGGTDPEKGERTERRGKIPPAALPPSFQFISNPKLQDDEFTIYRFIVISCTKSHMIFPKRNSNSELLLAHYAEIA